MPSIPESRAQVKKKFPADSHIWTYRGHRLTPVEWGLWRSLDDPKRFFLCYRPQGKHGICIRQWAHLTPGQLDLADLKQHVRTIRARMQEMHLGMEIRITAGEALAAYVAELERRGRTSIYTTDVRAVLNRFLKPESDAEQIHPVTMLRDITLERIEDFLSWLHRNEATPRTQNKYLSAVSGWLAWCVRRGYIVENPAARVEHAQGQCKLVDFPEPDEFLEIVRVSPPYDAGLWCLFVFTGMRRASVLSLTPESFRDDAILVPHTKRQAEWLLRFDDGCPLWAPDLSALGRDIWAQRPPTLRILRDSIKVLQDNGHAVTLHGFRHAFCSWLTMMGEKDQDVAAWAHHTTTITTRRYQHLRPRGLDRIATHREKVFTLRAQAMRLVLGERMEGIA